MSRVKGKMLIVVSVMLLIVFLLMLNWNYYSSRGLMYVLSKGYIFELEYGCEMLSEEVIPGYVGWKEECSYFFAYFKYAVILPFGIFLYGLYPLLSKSASRERGD